jgi:5-methylcytosine-specific restriction endonuclease McrA
MSRLARAPKLCSNYPCMDQALPGKRNCAYCGNQRWPTDQPDRYKRMRTPEMVSLREFVWERDQATCQIGYVGLCTYAATDLDHRKPLYLGGSDIDPDNLQAACNPCHAAKSSDEGHAAQGHKVVVRQRISDLAGE